MNISFVCNPQTGGRGTPTHARHCGCDRPWLFELDSCSRCGRFTLWTVRKTWHVQAGRHARRERLYVERQGPNSAASELTRRPTSYRAIGDVRRTPPPFVSPALAGVAL